ncbi:transmembrane protein 186-like [Amphibalanus amphitrite]|uniref:transmembrane protein 186-like n=1 Tax=Amphibalanus amphitrite TaxID=1232801 RepID=UPI001C91EE7E|nr:transmembrane protein 186-like [Amphibalanus amphitrite]
MSVRLICRLKIYQTGLTLAAVPVMVLLQDLDAAAKVGAVGLFAAGMLYIMGEFFRRFVGLLYLHRDGTQLKIAHLTFWGGRRDIVIPVEDIVPFSELKDSPTDVYFKLRRYSSPETFYVSLRYGGISSMESLEAVFGPLEER